MMRGQGASFGARPQLTEDFIMKHETMQAPAGRCVKIGRNLINLHNFLFTQTFSTRGNNSDGEFGKVFILKF